MWETCVLLGVMIGEAGKVVVVAIVGGEEVDSAGR